MSQTRTVTARTLTTVLVAAALVALPSTATQASEPAATNDPVATIISDTNAYRATKGKTSLVRAEQLDSVAAKYAQHLADTCKWEHNPKLRSQIPSHWSRIGENLLRSGSGSHESVAAISVRAWIGSEGHRKNLLGDYTNIGIGIATAVNGTCAGNVYVSMILGKYPKPSISGTKKVGATLTAQRGNALLPSNGSYRYQWYRNGVAIADATASTYKLTGADAGKKIHVRITAFKDEQAFSAYSTSKTGTIAKASIRSTTPKIIGSKKVGATLTADPGTWTDGATLKYQWYVNGKAVKGATGQQWKIPAAAHKKKISVKVTGSLSGYKSASKTKKLSTKVAAGTFQFGEMPISGLPLPGETLSVNCADLSPTASTITYQWYKNGKKISGATKSSYTVPSSATSGATYSVKVTVKRSAYTTTTKTVAAVTAPDANSTP